MGDRTTVGPATVGPTAVGRAMVSLAMVSLAMVSLGQGGRVAAARAVAAGAARVAAVPKLGDQEAETQVPPREPGGQMAGVPLELGAQETVVLMAVSPVRTAREGDGSRGGAGGLEPWAWPAIACRSGRRARPLISALPA